MILQVVSEKFANTHRFTVLLQSPTLPQTHLVVAVTMAGRPVGLRVSDGGSSARWRMPNDPVGGRALFYRVGNQRGGLKEVVVEPLGGQLISGTATAIEVAGISPGQAVQELADMLVEAG